MKSRSLLLTMISISVLALIPIGMKAFGQKPLAEPTVDEPYVPVNVLMQAKLEASQDLIKGLALEDFDLIIKQAQRLELLSRDTDWNILQTRDYQRISREFREAARQIREAAEKKNLDAVGLNYFKLTMSCIDCHRHVRAERK